MATDKQFKRILLVDDEPDIREVLQMAMLDAGYEVLMAENGEAALQCFLAERPPIVITDIKMPVMDGIELLKRIKREDPETEVIMITGHGDMDLAVNPNVAKNLCFYLRKSGSFLQHAERMQKIFSCCLICTHSKSDFALRTADSTSSLNNSMADRIQFLKFPGRRALCQSSWRGRTRPRIQVSSWPQNRTNSYRYYANAFVFQRVPSVA